MTLRCFGFPSNALLTLPCFLLAFLLLLACSGCAVSASGGVASPLDAQQQESSTSVVSPLFFGMVVREPGSVPAVTDGSRRLWDSGVTWAALEPYPGRFSWQTLDAEVAAALHQGEQVVLTLGMTPAWASSQPSLGSAYGNGATAMPANLADWDGYVSAVAARYAGRIAAYEVWNAPSDSMYWAGTGIPTGAAMAVLAAHAAADIHAIDPAASLVSPALIFPRKSGRVKLRCVPCLRGYDSRARSGGGGSCRSPRYRRRDPVGPVL